MIEPVLSDHDLQNQILDTTPEPGQVALWWLGQSGLLVKSHLATILIDPYLSESLTTKYAGTSKPHIRMTRCPMDPSLLTMIDLVCCSHKHSDHMDPVTLTAVLKASPEAILVLPTALIGHAGQIGIESGRLVGLDHGEVYENFEKKISIRAVSAAHEGLDQNELGQFLYLSFVMKMDGVKIFHSGDTIPWEGQREAVGEGVDVAFLPINGRDPSRGVPGNMTSDEAVDFATSLRARHLIPHHYDMFTFNTADVNEFAHVAGRLPAEVKPVILRCGERYYISR
jgi:L-ascorbate metabolism protein UlaG (beta-lactamase superfamily)